MIPTQDPTNLDTPSRRFPLVNTLLIAANLAIFIFYELPDLNAAIVHASSPGFGSPDADRVVREVGCGMTNAGCDACPRRLGKVVTRPDEPWKPQSL